MSFYFLLGTLTYEGQRMTYEDPDLPVDVIREINIEGAKILGQYAVLGRYDFVILAEADDNDAVARLSLELGVRIGMHMETLPALALRVFTDEEGERRREEIGAAATPGEWRLPNK